MKLLSALTACWWLATLADAEEEGTTMKTATPATTVEGHMIDLPAAYPDGSVRFHFRLERLERVVPADAVQVVVPESAVDGDVVWDGGDHVRVTGREGVFETP